MSEKHNFKEQWSKLRYVIIPLLTFAIIQVLRLCFVTVTGDIEEDWRLNYIFKFSFLCFLLPILYFLPKKLRFLANLSVVFVTPAVCLYIIQYLTVPLARMNNRIVLLNLLVIYIFAALLVFIIGRTDIAMSILLLFSALYSSVNYYVLMYHGTPILPGDLSSIDTALNVAGQSELCKKVTLNTFLETLYPEKGHHFLVAFFTLCVGL